MSRDSFEILHEMLEPALKEEFNVCERKRGSSPNGDIPTRLRLSAALRFFAGGSIYDIIVTHGISKVSVYKSIYGVVNVVNQHKSLAFNSGGAEFPSHAEQREIAAGFLKKSGAGFDKVVLALDGMLVWTIQPSRADCEHLKIGERMFHCYRKDKYGYLLMAGCDHETRFRWADIRHPAVCSDYLAWVTSDLGGKLEDEDCGIILPDHCIAGDNAFVENMTMATPVPGTNLETHVDAYNFYLSQLRITIERAFGILVHRWGLLRRPLAMSILKVPALVLCLMCLHNFCIDFDSRRTPRPIHSDELAIRRIAANSKKKGNKGEKPTAVRLSAAGTPSELLGSGHHFRDEPGGTGRRPASSAGRRASRSAAGRKTPMRKMMLQVENRDLRRPDIKDY
jgi:hypothetical protein